MGITKKAGIIFTGFFLLVSSYALPQAANDDFISLALSSALYPEFDDTYRILVLNIITHPESYYQRKEGKTYLTFKVINEEYQLELDELALDSGFVNMQLLIKSVYGKRSYYRLEKGEMAECWFTERGVKFSHDSDNPSTNYSLDAGYFDFMRHIKKFNSYLVQKRTKNIKSKHLRRAYRMVNSIRDTQYSRLKKMIQRYDRFVAKRLRKQERKLERAKRRMERENEKEKKQQEKQGNPDKE
jgi:hypothetical protein